MGTEQYSNILYNDYSHNIIDNLVPLESLALHVRMDNDLFYDMGLHLGASLPSTISVALEQRPGEIMANTVKRAQNANPP